jgi:hypothetical protein
LVQQHIHGQTGQNLRPAGGRDKEFVKGPVFEVVLLAAEGHLLSQMMMTSM